MASQFMQYISDFEDEIALEGLDGITLEALWTRLRLRPNFEANMPIDDDSKAFLWSMIVEDEEISCYSLPEPRDQLVIFNRYEHMDPELGIVLEPEEEPKDIYPFHPVEDEKKGVRGSCKFYHKRVDVTATATRLSLPEAELQYGQKLVLVASQRLRDKALVISAFIDKFYDLSLTQYVILERIGRSRRMGEITQGKVSLAMMGENAKTMFYHRKRLLKLNLITKQPHQQKGTKGQSNGSLLHLTRFYVERRSKFIMMIQRAVEILKAKPGHCAPYVVIKEEMGMPETSCRKLFKSNEFQRFIKNVTAPFRKVYPDAPPSQWRCKAKDAEKFVRIMELVNPNVDPLDVCKVDDADDDEDDSYSGILDQSRVVWGVGLLQQAYRVVEEAGPEGVSQTDMARLMGQTKLDSRTICRNLQRRNTVHSLMKDVGRQRVSRYVSHKFASTGHLTQEFRKERQKMMAMMEANKANDTPAKGEVSRVLESNSLEGVEVGLEMLAAGQAKSKVTEAQASRRTPDRRKTRQDNDKDKDENKGFLRILEEIRLTYSNQKLSSPHVTTRMMKRANMIIETVASLKVIDDAFKLQKMIVQAETEEGYAVKMDKKSLNRLLEKLARGGFLKNIIVKLKCNNLVKMVQFVVHPSINFESPHLKSAIEQQKLKFLASTPDSKQEGEATKSKPEKLKCKSEGAARRSMEEDSENGINSSVGASMQELKQMHQVSSSSQSFHTASAIAAQVEEPEASASAQRVVKKEVGVKGSLGPKFVRMCELHKLLFYIVYGFEGNDMLNQDEAWNIISAASPEAQVQNEDLNTYPTVYYPELSWKMFIPALPNHMNSESGWAFVCDILLRLPLCIFVRLVNICNYTAEIDTFLSHPIKRNLLVKYLPPHIRQALLQGRRYVTYVIELINRLCYVGLLQYGHQIMKEKDQVFIYVNRRASLIDTTTSGPGYHQISADKEYVRKEYYFNILQDILQYWYDMWTISMHTPLGGHNCMQGKKITIQILDRKPQIIESLTPRSTHEAPLRDIGSIPGDGRGACGLDSAMFAHLKRNWSSNSGHSSASRPSALLPPNTEGNERASYEGTASYTQYLMNTTNPSQDNPSFKHRLAGLRNVQKLSVYKPRMGTDSKCLEIPVGLVPRTPKGRKRKRESLQPLETPESKVVKPRRGGRPSKANRPASYQRELKMRKKSPKKPYYDEEDRAALRRMNKLRVDWTSAEDSFLLLCKVASCFLFPNKRSQMITFSQVRDMLHKRFPESSLNKTSRACQRRINYIMKNPTTEDNVAIFLEEVRQDASIVADFKGPRLPRNKKNIESIFANMFRNLMNRLVVKFASSESRQCPDLPATIEEFHQKHKIIMAASSLRSKLRFKEITSTSDIDFHVVNALIYSSLCSKHDRESYAYQLYLAYQQYPQALLNAVLNRMRHDQMISYKKSYNRSIVAQTCLPLSTSPFQLSVTYHHVFNFRYQYEIYTQSWRMLKQLLTKKHKAILDLQKPSKEVEPEAEIDNQEDMKEAEVRNAEMKETDVREAEEPTENQEEKKEMEGSQEEGVPVVILHEGGYCAAIVALLATKRLTFDIVIPEQIIMMDQQQRLMEDQHQSLLKRFSSHSQMAGKEVDLQEEESQVGDKFKKRKERKGSTKVNEQEDKGRDSVLSGDREESESIASCSRDESNSAMDMKDISNTAEESDIGETTTDTGKRKTRSVGRANPKRVKYANDDIDKDFTTSEKDTLRVTPISSKDKGTEEMSLSAEDEENSRSKVDDFTSELEGDESTNLSVEDAYRSVRIGDVSSAEGEDGDTTITSTSKVGQSSASRLGLYMMRDQLTLAEVDQINIQHAQEHLVVNACEITIRLRPPPSLQDMFDEAVQSGNNEAADDILMPLPNDMIQAALSKRKRVTLDNWQTLEHVIQKWRAEGESEDILYFAQDVFEYIHSWREVGASIRDLKERYGSDCSIGILVIRMEEAQLLLRVGVASVRWVTMAYTKPWLIHTNKISRKGAQTIKSIRLNTSGVYKIGDAKGGSEADQGEHSTAKDHETLGETSQDANITMLNQDTESTDTQVNAVDTSTVQPTEEECVLPENSTSVTITDSQDETGVQDMGESSTTEVDASQLSTNENMNDTNDTSTLVVPSRRSRRISLRDEEAQLEEARQRELMNEVAGESSHIRTLSKRPRPRYKLNEMPKERERTFKQYDASDYEQISVAVRPWVRLNGTLNRRVLDRLLGAVLNLIMERPGISGQDIVYRFSPALQPAHTHDLLDTLVQIQCIVPLQLSRSHQPSLFSDTVDYSLEVAEIFDCDDDLLYEPNVDAILKLAVFIGDKKYGQDFLCGERR